ncbi:hypothetical protein BJ970_004364 [Saccharopolyspora phatthalungensis]|uniref:Uncharacterized protein n=1 Tax=Saccharopolyspora phatthalungensis TaxID=664693 RepID=A0A840QAI1_9PSEU|nr:hypothetical protein [Saccharopolyspora phatthalungensis]
MGGARPHDDYWDPTDPQRQDELRWYRYLIISRSRPSTHLKAFSRMEAEDLKTGPSVITDLIDHVRTKMGL